MLCEACNRISGRRVTREMRGKIVKAVRTVITSFRSADAKSIRSERIRRERNRDVKLLLQVQHDRRSEHDEDRERSRLQADDRLAGPIRTPKWLPNHFEESVVVVIAAAMFN